MTEAKERALQAITALSGPTETRVNAARHIKNDVVGNPTNKQLYLSLGVLSPLIAATNDVEKFPQLAEQAVAAMGSLACYFPEDAIHTVVPATIKCIYSSDLRPVNAAVRALKLFTFSETMDLQALAVGISNIGVASNLVSLLSSADEGVAEVCAVILARTCVSLTQVTCFERVSAIPALVSLMCRTNHERCIEACLNALSSLARYSRAISQTLTGQHALIPVVLPFTRSSTHSLRLSACRLFTIFYSAGHLPSDLDGVVTTSLVNLLEIENLDTQILTASTLAELVQGSLELKTIATEAGAVKILANILAKFTMSTKKKNKEQTDNQDEHQIGELEQQESVQTTNKRMALRASVMTSLASLAHGYNIVGDTIVELNVLPNITSGLFDKDPKVVLSSIKCIRSLSRSVKVLRRDIADESVGIQLLQLLGSEDNEIRRCASATVGNLVLEFSLLRTTILARGGTKALIKLLLVDDEELRKNALLTFKNILFKADSDTKTAVMDELEYDRLQILCNDKHPRVRELAMTIVRNLAYSDSTDSRKEHLDALFAATKGKLIPLLSESLKEESENSEVGVQALYAVVNIASGTESHKASLMRSDIPQLILKWFLHQDERARIAAVWCAINLSWRERPVPLREFTMTHRSTRFPSGNPTSTTAMLRRQRLPLPSSPSDRRALQTYDMTDRDSSMSNSEHESDVHMTERLLNSRRSRDQGSERGEEQEANINTEMTGPRDQNQEDEKQCGYRWRIGRLRELGFEGRLRHLMNDPHIEVQGRAKEALELLDCNDIGSLNYNPSALLDYNQTSLARHSPRSPVVLRSHGSGSFGRST